MQFVALILAIALCALGYFDQTRISTAKKETEVAKTALEEAKRDFLKSQTVAADEGAEEKRIAKENESKLKDAQDELAKVQVRLETAEREVADFHTDVEKGKQAMEGGKLQDSAITELKQKLAATEAQLAQTQKDAAAAKAAAEVSRNAVPAAPARPPFTGVIKR